MVLFRLSLLSDPLYINQRLKWVLFVASIAMIATVITIVLLNRGNSNDLSYKHHEDSTQLLVMD